MSEPSTLDRLPPRVLPLLYFGFGQLCLAAAFLLLLWQPGVLAGFFYQTATLAVVHLITLGWITGSILGAVYLIGPIALRMHLRANRLDYAAFAFFAFGATGIAGHFWIDSYSGMLWSAAMLLAGIAWVGGRTILSLTRLYHGFSSRRVGDAARATARSSRRARSGAFLAPDQALMPARGLPPLVTLRCIIVSKLQARKWF